MSTSTPSDAPVNRGAVIRVDPLASRPSPMMELMRAFPAWIISAVLHAALLFLFWWIVDDVKADAQTKQQAPEARSKIEKKEAEDVILTNVEEGIDPRVPTNYDVPRIEEHSVPGPSDLSQNIGIAGEPPGPPQTLPPPPGSGGGQGGARFDVELPGSGFGNREFIGGVGGRLNFAGGFGGRSGSTRKRMVTVGGGSDASEAAVARGLEWLALHQCINVKDRNGKDLTGAWLLDDFQNHWRTSLDEKERPRFDSKSTGRGQANDVAGTAFGLLPFLAAGETHIPKKPTKDNPHPDNRYVKTVRRAIDWLKARQNSEGSWDGCGMYAHGLATIALCEAFGLTSDKSLRLTAQKALKYIENAQDPSGGGWRYRPREAGDTSVVGWQLMALKSGQMAGLSVSTVTLKKAEQFLNSVEKSSEGKFSYTPGSPATPTMTAVGLLCRQYLGVPRRNPSLQSGVKWLLDKYRPGTTKNLYYEYYATQVMHHMGEEEWDRWNLGEPARKIQGMRDYLIASQEKTGPAKGSWNPAGDAHGSQGGRIMITSLSLLTLEVYYRHLPLYQRDATMSDKPRMESTPK